MEHSKEWQVVFLWPASLLRVEALWYLPAEGDFQSVSCVTGRERTGIGLKALLWRGLQVEEVGVGHQSLPEYTVSQWRLVSWVNWSKVAWSPMPDLETGEHGAPFPGDEARDGFCGLLTTVQDKRCLWCVISCKTEKSHRLSWCCEKWGQLEEN